uniref:Uncharacterized protein n=1 Tax=Anguilla anguilla TaxID=7936 RepID=A0A0E9PRM4_ANGAN
MENMYFVVRAYYIILFILFCAFLYLNVVVF